MLKRFTCSVYATAAVLILLAGSSALAASAVRSAKARAANGHGHRSKHGRKAHRKTRGRSRPKTGTAVHQTASPSADGTSGTVLLGDSAIENQSDSLVAGQAEAFRLQAHATQRSVLAHVYMGAGNSAHLVIVGVYSSSGQQPGSLLSVGSASVSRPGTWTEVPISSVELTSGKTYWLAVLGRGGTLPLP